MSRPGGKVYRGAVYGVKAAVWKLPCLACMGGPYGITLALANPSSPVVAACAPKILGYWYPRGLKVARSIAPGGPEASLLPGPALLWATPRVLCCVSWLGAVRNSLFPSPSPSPSTSLCTGSTSLHKGSTILA